MEEIVCPMKVLCSQESESAYEACVTEHALNVSALWEEVVKASWDKTVCYIYGITPDEDLGEICHSEFFGVRKYGKKDV